MNIILAINNIIHYMYAILKNQNLHFISQITYLRENKRVSYLYTKNCSRKICNLIPIRIN